MKGLKNHQSANGSLYIQAHVISNVVTLHLVSVYLEAVSHYICLTGHVMSH